VDREAQGAFAYDLRFPGQFFDQATKLHYNYFRDYDPRLGRYIESDPIGLDGGINTYAYGSNDPLRHVDPLGTQGAASGGVEGNLELGPTTAVTARRARTGKKNALNSGKATRNGAMKTFVEQLMWLASSGQPMSSKGV
jgi:RHS repeat-associated protein